MTYVIKKDEIMASVKRQRRRSIFLLLLPVICLLWIVGWTLSFVGDKKAVTPLKQMDQPTVYIPSEEIHVSSKEEVKELRHTR